MADCVPTPTATQFATEIDTTTLRTTTLLRESTSTSVETGSFPSTICAGTGTGSIKCSLLIITYRITSASTIVVPTATSTVVSRITNIIPQQTLFAPCTIAGDALSSVSSGQTQSSSSGSSNTNHAAIIGGVVSGVVILGLSIIGFFMWSLWRKNRAMKAALAEHELKEDEVNMAQFLPTPYPFTPPGPNDIASLSTPRNPSSYDYSSAYTHQQGVLGLSVPSRYSMSPSTNPGFDTVTNDMYSHTHTDSLRPSTPGSQTHSIATLPPPGPSGTITSEHPPGHQRMSAVAEAKAREARMGRQMSIPDGRLRAVNIAEGEGVDPAHQPLAWTAPPPAYSQDA